MPLGDDDCSFAGVEVKFKGMVYPVLIQPNHIPELTSVSPNSSGLRVGAAVTLNDLEQALRNEIELQPGKNMFRLIFRKYDEVDFNIN
jgi:xanthine dehydrogenase iron-sulfur cluster and FAD-binding subunit A